MIIIFLINFAHNLNSKFFITFFFFKVKQKEETTFLSQNHLYDNRPQMEDESVNESIQSKI